MALTAAPEDQALLLDLQALDTKLAQLAHRASTLPEAGVVTELTAGREALQRRLVEQTGAVEDARLELRRTESDVEVVDARIMRDRDRLQSSSSVKDIQAFEQELAALAVRKSDLEDIELAVMETVEARDAELAATRAELAELDERIAAAIAARDAALEVLAADRRHAEANRATVAGKVPADLLALYEKQRARYGVGVLRAGGEAAIDDQVAVVRVVRLAVFGRAQGRVGAQIPEEGQVGAPGEGDHLNRERAPLKQVGDALGVICDDDEALACAGDHLLPQQRAAEALDELKGWIDLVRAVDAEVKLGVIFQVRGRDPKLLAGCGGALRGGDADDVGQASFAERGSEVIEEVGDRAPGAEP